jgi:hypothetical protein
VPRVAHATPVRSRNKRRGSRPRRSAIPSAQRSPKSTLTAEQKLLIVHRLAHWVPPSTVQDELRERYGIDVPFTTIAYYDATGADTDLAKKWRDVFRQTRERYLDDMGDVAIAHRKMRIKELLALYEIDKKRGATMSAAQHLKQIAQEMGGQFTNHHVIESSDPITELVKVTGASREEIIAAWGLQRDAE